MLSRTIQWINFNRNGNSEILLQKTIFTQKQTALTKHFKLESL